MNTFENMDLFEPLRRALKDKNYTKPTPIQMKSIPAGIQGRDILGCAQTGTGKTAAFALPILDFIGHNRPQRVRKAASTLVLAPTRELAIQIAKSFETYGKHMRFNLATIYGGVNQRQQINAIKQGVDALVATPGRLLDLAMQNHVCLKHVQMFVLDEADRMLDMGFLPDLRKIISKLPDQRQSLFFSATLPKNTADLANRLLFNPVHIKVETKPADVHRISQSIRMVQRERKFTTLHKLLAEGSVEQAIVFTRTKHCANRVAKKLTNQGVNSTAIHGSKSQSARQDAIEDFRQKRISVLVATDLASRGIDFHGISHVINYDMPVDPECYVHRIGRTARAGTKGVAISLCTLEERKELRAIEKLIGQRISVDDSGVQNVKQNRKTAKRSHATH